MVVSNMVRNFDNLTFGYYSNLLAFCSNRTLLVSSLILVIFALIL